MKQDLGHLQNISMQWRWNTRIWLLDVFQSFYQQITYFYLKLGRDLLLKMIRKKQFSKDLPQGEMELPTVYVFRSTNLVMHSQLRGHVSDTMKTYNDAKSKTFGKNDKPKKKKNNNKNMYIWALFLKAKKSLKDNFFSQFYAINLALIINANLCCSRIGIFLALSIFVSYEK